jgi:hypothetical protein
VAAARSLRADVAVGEESPDTDGDAATIEAPPDR